MSSPLVSREEAHKLRTHHQFVPGIGYLRHAGAPTLPADAKGTKNCAPPAGTKDGTVHMLRTPTGAPPIAFVWIAAEQAWATANPLKGNRLAWAPAHLQRAGWEYIGPKS